MSYECPCCKSELVVSQDSSSVSFRCKKCNKRTKDFFTNIDEAYQSFCNNPFDCPEDDPEIQKQNKIQKELDSINRLLRPQEIHEGSNSRTQKISEPNQSGSSDESEETVSDFQTKDARDSVLREIKRDSFLNDTFDDGFEFKKFEVIHVIQKNPTKPEPASDESCEIINPKLYNLLKEKDRLPYRHQVETLEKSMAGNNVYIKSPTSSGKTISFLLPILNEILNSDSKKLCAVIIYPTKALTKDQLKEIDEYTKELDVTLERLDGNIGKKDGIIDQKYRIDILNKKPQILLTNIDFIASHMGEHDPFSNKFNELMMDFKFLVIDEIHKYGGTFGTKLAGTLQRMNHKYGKFQTIAASATLENPEEFANSLGLSPVEIVTGQGNRGMMTISMLYPGPKCSQRDVMVDILAKLTDRNHRSLSFSNSRMGAEEIAIEAEEKMIKIKVHRAGLLPEVIENNENEFLNGELDSLSSTPTLEVGINIGDLTGVVSEFVPYYTLTQRIGRGGRSGQDSYGFVVLDTGDPVSQFYKFHPQYYEKENLDILIDVNNDLLKKITLLLASRDKPFTEKDIETIKENSDNSSFPGHGESMASLMEDDLLVQRDDGTFTSTLSIPDKNLKNFSLRDIGQTVNIKLDGNKIGDWDMPMAFEKLFEGSIYLHDRETYRCSKFSKNKFPVPEIVSDVHLVTDDEKNLRTQPVVDVVPEIEETLSEEFIFGLGYSLCFLNIKKTIAEYVQYGISKPGKEAGGSKTALKHVIKSIQPCSIDSPTTGIVFDLEGVLPEILKSSQIAQEFHNVLHSFEHLLIQSGNSMTGGVSGDIDGITLSNEKKIFLFDKSTNGGNGACNRIFSNVKELIQRADEIVKLCECKIGCPKCIKYTACSKRNVGLTKTGVLTLLKILTKGDTFIDKYDVQQNDVQQNDVQQNDVQQNDVPPKDWTTKTMEDEKTEFKSSIRINVDRYDHGEIDHLTLKDDTLVEEIVKTICGFGNADGGELIIGKRDDGTIFGLEYDMKLFKKPNIDQLKNYLASTFRKRIKDMGFVSKLKIYWDTIDGKTICLVKVPSRGKKAIFTSDEKFYARIQTSTPNLSPEETNDYITENFSN